MSSRIGTLTTCNRIPFKARVFCFYIFVFSSLGAGLVVSEPFFVIYQESSNVFIDVNQPHIEIIWGSAVLRS
jgi:hypothetical protein